jgi:Carboxypeptidase regulatory-like domain
MLEKTVLLILFVALPIGAQSRSDLVRGRVTTDSGKAVPDAEIIITMAPTRVVVSGKGDSTGAYELRIPNGTGEYLLYISAVGRLPLRKRLTAAGGDTVFVVDAKLAAAPVVTLAAVLSVASRPRPSRTSGLDDGRQGLTGTDRTPDGVNGQLPPDLAASLDAIASSLPGFTLTPDGIWALGTSGANLSTLNGLAMGISDLPRDARATTRFQTSPWDPAKGGFAGAQLGFSLPGGGEVSQRRSHLTLDAPQLQVAQPSATLLGQKLYNVDAGYGADGAIVPGEYFYSYAVSGRRVTTPVSSLLDLNASALTPNGVARDSAQRLLNILLAQKIPLTLIGIPTDRTTTSGAFIARFDRHSQPPATPGGISSNPWWLLATGSLRKNEANSLSPVSVPAFGGTQQNGLAGLSGFYSTYAGPGRLWLNETQFALSANANRGDPYLNLPGGNVLVSSLLDDGTQSVRSLSFGGNSASFSRTDAWSAEVVNSTTFYPGVHTTKPLRIFTQGRYDGFDQTVAASRLGTFSYPSLADLASNTPSGFSRTLNAPDRIGGEYTGAAAVGVNWSLGKVNLIGGVRADGNAFTKTPSLDPSVDSIFGLATDQVPNTIALSPRVGFNWTYKPSGTSMNMGNLGGFWRGPTTIRGGVGRFRSLLAPTTIADALTSTGLPGGARRLSCVGPATPVPNWQSFAVDTATVPTQCAGGASTFADASPNVIGFDPRYGPQDSWRATLGSTRTMLNRVYLAVDGTYSLNLGQGSGYDLNFAGTPQFTLNSEAARPVYVSPSSIVTTTGALSPVESRRSGTFGRVTERRSDLRSEAKQLIIHTLPNVKSFDPFLSVDYVYSDVRRQTRGFDVSTAGDPRLAQWGRDPFEPRHKFIVQTGKSFKGFTLTAVTTFASGVPFTPLVGGDINGDGSWNDRAFIGDSIPRLMAGAPARVQNCLKSQLGQIAGQNSCVGPWTSWMNARLGYSNAIPRLGRRANFSLNLANPLAGLDLLFHGSDALHGWGSQAQPDQTLLYVRGFNATNKSFIYEVNRRFGATSPQTTAFLNPFRVTIDMQFDLSRDRDVQGVEISLRPPRGQKTGRANADTIKMRFLSGVSSNGPQDVYKYILSLKDSLALSREQITKLEAARVTYRAKMDSIYTNLANYLATLPPAFDGPAAAKRIRDMQAATWQTVADEGKPIQAIITPTQMQLLWQPVIITLTKYQPGSTWAMGGSAWLDPP